MRLVDVVRGMVLSFLLSFMLDAQSPAIAANEFQTIHTIKQIKFVEKYKVGHEKAKEIVTVVQEYASQFNLDPREFLALIAIESSFRSDAISRSGAMGYVQHIDKWHPEKIKYIQNVLGYYDQFEMRSNLLMGVLISIEYKRRFGKNWLQAYNGSMKDRSMKYTKKFNLKFRELST